MELIVKTLRFGSARTRLVKCRPSDTIHTFKEKIIQTEKDVSGEDVPLPFTLTYYSKTLLCENTLQSYDIPNGETITLKPEPAFDLKHSVWFGTDAIYARPRGRKAKYSALPDFHMPCGCPLQNVTFKTIRVPQDCHFIWKASQFPGCPDQDTFSAKNIRLLRLRKGLREDVETMLVKRGSGQAENKSALASAELRPLFLLENGTYVLSINEPVQREDRIRRIVKEGEGPPFPGPIEARFVVQVHSRPEGHATPGRRTPQRARQGEITPVDQSDYESSTHAEDTSHRYERKEFWNETNPMGGIRNSTSEAVFTDGYATDETDIHLDDRGAMIEMQHNRASLSSAIAKDSPSSENTQHQHQHQHQHHGPSGGHGSDNLFKTPPTQAQDSESVRIHVSPNSIIQKIQGLPGPSAPHTPQHHHYQQNQNGHYSGDRAPRSHSRDSSRHGGGGADSVIPPREYSDGGGVGDEDDGDWVMVGKNQATPQPQLQAGRPNQMLQRRKERPLSVCESAFVFIPFWVRVGFWLAVMGLVSFVLLRFPGGYSSNGLILGIASLGSLVCFLIICALLDRCLGKWIERRRFTEEMEIIYQDDPLYARDPSLWTNRSGHEAVGQIAPEEEEEGDRKCQRCLQHELGWCACVTVCSIICFIGGWLLAYRFIGHAPMRELLARNGFWGHY